MPQIGSNIYAIGMITALRDYVRLLRAIPMLTLSSHHRRRAPLPLRPVRPSFHRRPSTPLPTFSMTSRVNGKSGLLNDRSRDTRIVRLGHATSVSMLFRFFSADFELDRPRFDREISVSIPLLSTRFASTSISTNFDRCSRRFLEAMLHNY